MNLIIIIFCTVSKSVRKYNFITKRIPSFLMLQNEMIIKHLVPILEEYTLNLFLYVYINRILLETVILSFSLFGFNVVYLLKILVC